MGSNLGASIGDHSGTTTAALALLQRRKCKLSKLVSMKEFTRLQSFILDPKKLSGAY